MKTCTGCTGFGFVVQNTRTCIVKGKKDRESDLIKKTRFCEDS